MGHFVTPFKARYDALPRIVGWADISVVTIPNVAMRYVSRYLGHDAIRIAILVYRVSQCLDLHTHTQIIIVNTPE